MAAFSAEGNFVPSLPAHPLRAIAPNDPSLRLRLAICGNSLLQHTKADADAHVIGVRIKHAVAHETFPIDADPVGK